jgi:hypothetical protein
MLLPLQSVGLAHAQTATPSPPQPPPASPAPTPTPSTSSEPQEPARSEEIDSERTRYAKVYEQPDGSRVAEISSDPIHFPVGDGTWKEIDNTLVRQSDGNGFVNRANDLKVSFAGSADSPSLVDADYGPKAITLALAGATNAQPHVSGNKITYPNILPAVDLVFEVSGETIKEYLVLKARPRLTSGDFTVRFPFEVEGVTASETSNGGIDFRNASGETIFSIPHLFMYDSYSTAESGGEHAVSEDVHLSVEESDGKQYIRVTARRLVARGW